MTTPKALLGVAALLVALQATAHHSGAMFDDRKSLTLIGTVKTFQWTNPHCWIQVLAPGPQGPVEWSVEMGSPSQLIRGGWKPRSLKVGESIRITIHPMRDGSNGGLYMSAARANGTPIAVPVTNGSVAAASGNPQ